MNVTSSTQIALMTKMMAQQVQQMAKIQKMIAESVVKLAEGLADPNLGQNIDICV